MLEAHLKRGGGRGLLRGHVAVRALGEILAAGVIVGLHFAVVFANAVQNPVRLGVVRIVEELDIARQTRLRVGVLVRLAEREPSTGYVYFGSASSLTSSGILPRIEPRITVPSSNDSAAVSMACSASTASFCACEKR